MRPHLLRFYCAPRKCPRKRAEMPGALRPVSNFRGKCSNGGGEDKKCKYHCLRHSPGELMGGGCSAAGLRMPKKVNNDIGIVFTAGERLGKHVFCILAPFLWFLTSLQKVFPCGPRGMNTLSPTYCIRRQQFRVSRPSWCACVWGVESAFPFLDTHTCARRAFPHVLVLLCVVGSCAWRRIRKTF